MTQRLDRIVAVGLLAAVTLAFAAARADASPVLSATPALGDADGLRVVSEHALDARLLDVVVSSAALPGPADVRILLPSGYAAHLRRRYPVLYLLHGTSGSAADWTEMGRAEQTTAGEPLIVVMPDIGLDDDGGGWCANWVSAGGHGKPPQWETFHIRELVPWIDRELRTIPTRGERAIAGLSQGGFCAMSYAARHPDVFGTALSFSGAPDIAYDPTAAVTAEGIVNYIEVSLDHVAADSIFGSPLTDELNWAAHDPTTLAENLNATNLFIFSGNGQPGPLDGPSPDPEAEFLEGLVGTDSALFHDRLEALGIPSFYDAYGPGTHSWPYWTRDLQQSIGPLMADFADPRPVPASVTYTSASAAYSIYGWQVTTHRTAAELSTLENAGRAGFALAGSGSATVVTPPEFAPGQRYEVTWSGPTAGMGSSGVVATAAGRLRIAVPLGPSNPFQQDTVPALLAGGTRVYTTTVQIDT